MKSTVTIIDPKKKRLSLNLRELWAYRDLFITLTYRDFRVRYAQTFLGFAWAFLQPLATLAIFTIIFYLADVKAIDGVPFPVFFACGLSAWTYFAFVMNHSGESLINASEMIKKIYFPRLIIPVSKSVVGLVDLIITLLIIGGLMIYFGIAPSVNLIFLPLFILMTIITALSVGIWISALTTRFRDMKHLIPTTVQLGFYITPLAYPSDFIVGNLPAWASVVYFLNPMAGIVEGFRWSVLGGIAPSNYAFISYGIIIILFFTSLAYFKKTERSMADII